MTGRDARQHAPATQRNREPILALLREVLPQAGLVLEVASGTGEHAAFFARQFPALEWQPSDPSPDARQSIEAWAEAEGLTNVPAPLPLDAVAGNWPIERADAIVCINMIHISPWEATEGLMRGAGRILPAGAPLFTYGPFIRPGHQIEPSNRAFDQDLRRREPRWGLRSLDAVSACAEANGLMFDRFVEMPANNLSVIYRRRSGSVRD